MAYQSDDTNKEAEFAMDTSDDVSSDENDNSSQTDIIDAFNKLSLENSKTSDPCCSYVHRTLPIASTSNTLQTQKPISKYLQVKLIDCMKKGQTPKSVKKLLERGIIKNK